MALVKLPMPPTSSPYSNSTVISAAASPLSTTIFAIALPIGLAVGYLVFPYVERWVEGWLLRQEIGLDEDYGKVGYEYMSAHAALSNAEIQGASNAMAPLFSHDEYKITIANANANNNGATLDVNIKFSTLDIYANDDADDDADDEFICSYTYILIKIAEMEHSRQISVTADMPSTSTMSIENTLSTTYDNTPGNEDLSIISTVDGSHIRRAST